MGLVVFPFLFAAAICFLWALIIVILKFIKKTIELKEFVFGLVLAVLIYGLLYFDYISSDKVYRLGAYFVFPFFIVMLPFFISIFLNVFHSSKILRLLCNVLLVSAVVGGVIILLFQNYTLNIVEHLNLNKNY